jgi:putative aldouronate transport system substrate-binding protein
MKKRKLLATILTVMVVTTSLFLGGCKSKETNQDSSQTGKPQENTKKEVVSLKFLGPTDKFNPAEDVTRQKIKDMLGFDIIPEMGIEEDKINLILSSDQEYDIIKFSNRALLANYIKNKAIQPLNEYIDKYGPNLKKAFSQEVWDMLSVDGKIYAIPNTNYQAVTEGIGVRKDWLNKLNLKEPTTVDEFYNMLKAFKDNNPDGLDKSKVVPLTFMGENTNFGLNGLAQAFGLGVSPVSYIEKDGKLVLGLEEPGAKEYMQFLRKLYKEGLLDPDFPSNKWGNFDQKLGSGFVGSAVMACWFPTGQKALMEKGPDSKYIYIEPLKAKDGTQRNVTTGGLEHFIIVPRSSKKAAEVVKFANAFLAPENYTKLIIGDEGDTYKIENGKYLPIYPAFDSLNLARWFFPANEGKMYTPLFSARAWKVKEQGEMWEDINSRNAKFGYLDPMTFSPLMEENTKYSRTLDALAREKLMKMVLDDSELAKFDDFVKEYKAKGADELTRAYNAWYQSKSKK